MQDQLQTGRSHAGHLRRQIAVIFIATLLMPGLSGCWKPVPPPNIHVNPNPTERYRFVLTLVDPPPHGEVTADMNYYIENNGRCIPSDKTKALGGHTPQVTRKIPLVVTKVSDTKYEAVYYRDFFKDENYYGMGTCVWGGMPNYTISIRGHSLFVGPGNRFYKLGVPIEKKCPLKSNLCLGSDHLKAGIPHFIVTIATYKD